MTKGVTAAGAAIRSDLQIIADMVEARSRALDIGCGDGALLDYLGRAKGVDGRGIEIRQEGVNACVSQGLSVIHGDADEDLDDYPTGAFDYAILSRTLQNTRDPRWVLGELVRIARYAIVSFPNFGHWRVRWMLLVNGRMPITQMFDDPWFASPNIHPCTIKDFLDLARDMGIEVARAQYLTRKGVPMGAHVPRATANLFAEQAIFLLTKRG
jgi:methionine biosynthesis protein MetW